MHYGKQNKKPRAKAAFGTALALSKRLEAKAIIDTAAFGMSITKYTQEYNHPAYLTSIQATYT